MREFRSLGVVVLLALGLGLLPATAAFATVCKREFGSESTASTCKDELAWIYDPASRTFRYGSVIAPPKGKAKGIDPYKYKQDFACDANSTNPGSAVGCTRAYDCSPKLDPDGKPMRGVRVQAFRKLKADPKDPWRAINDGVCRYSGRTVPMAKVLAVGQAMKGRVGKPEIIAQPPNRVTLVNFTSLFHAPVQEVTTLKITQPVSGVITAIPRYTWDLGDGITAEGAGHPYHDQVDPKSPDSDGYYVKAFYRTRGVKEVRLTLTWEVSVKLDGFGVVPLAPIVFTEVTTTTAKTSHARLVHP